MTKVLMGEIPLWIANGADEKPQKTKTIMRERIYWIDAIKVVAILMVVLAHVLWMLETEEHGSEVMQSGSFFTLNRIVASLGVPLFMMVSGALLLGKKFETKGDVLTFYKRGLLPLVVTAEIWIVIYCCLRLRPFSLKELLLNMALVHKPEVHLWYVRLIVIYYLAIPSLNLLKDKWRLGLVVLLGLVTVFSFGYNAWLILRGDMCPTSPSRSYFCYLVYMAVGYWLSQVSISRKSLLLAVVFLILGGAIFVSVVDE